MSQKNMFSIASLTADDEKASRKSVNISFLGREHGREPKKVDQDWKW